MLRIKFTGHHPSARADKRRQQKQRSVQEREGNRKTEGVNMGT